MTQQSARAPLGRDSATLGLLARVESGTTTIPRLARRVGSAGRGVAAAVAAVAAAAPAEAGDVNPLERLFASAMRTTDQPRPAAAQAPAEAPAGPSKRERVWSAVQNLLANDQFLDMIVAELDRSGAL
mmetsp:Transcript_25178/g.63452  ORF Transcript_25178/g.63452 Transcript_25178/m.63452 type:complete len:128 (-) Transcript_25178:335-718(-)